MNVMRQALLGAVLLTFTALPAGQPGQTLDETVAPGINYDKADFRFWYTGDASRLDAVVVLVPGSNGDGRSQVDDATGSKRPPLHCTISSCSGCFGLPIGPEELRVAVHAAAILGRTRAGAAEASWIHARRRP